LSPGDVVNISGAGCVEIEGNSYLWVNQFEGDIISVSGSTEIPWHDITHEEVNVDSEAWESCPLHFTEGFESTRSTNPVYEWWEATSLSSGLSVLFIPLSEFIQIWTGDCYQGAFGIWDWHSQQGMWDRWFFRVVLDGLQVIDCSLPIQQLSFGAVKALYR